MKRYSLADFGEVEKTAGPEFAEILPGKVIRDIPDMLSERLKTLGGGKYNDASRQDSSDITALLKCGLTPQDAYSTFTDSARGKDAQVRKIGHYNDYLQRTLRNSLTFLGKTLEDYKPKKIKPSPNGNRKHPEIVDNTLHINFARKRELSTKPGINVNYTDGIETETTRWLWEGYIPEGKLTILAGDPGMGKSQIALDLIARISRGSAFPFSDRSVSGTCLIASAEDAPEDTITPRLIAANANLSRVGIIRQVRIDDELHYLSFPRDLQRLRNLTIKTGARLLIIDPLNAFLERNTDSHKDQDIRSVLAPIEDMAEETSTAIMIIAHLNKKEESSTLYRVGGSVGFVGAARSVLAVSYNSSNKRVLYSIKSNLGKTPSALAYDTRQVKKTRTDPKEWLGEETITSSCVKWQGKVDFDPSSKTGSSKEKADNESEEFLKQALLEGQEVKSSEIIAEARRAGISRSSLMQVKTDMGLKMKKGRDGEWYWRLP